MQAHVTPLRSSVSTRFPAVRLAPLPLALVVVLLLATAYGSVSIPPGETARILLYKFGVYAGHRSWSLIDENIIWQIRLPRVLAAALVGAALSVAGALFQAVLRNPLADPYVIGTSAGAQLGVIVALVLPLQLAVLGFGSVQVLAFLFALMTVLLVYGVARTAGRTPVVTLLLAGFVVSSFLISATTFLMLITNRTQEVMMWTMGSLDVSELTQLGVTGPVIVVVAGAAIVAAPQLDVMLLGEEQAYHLGVRVERLKVATIVLATLLTGLAVTLAGIVAFVGLIVPHAARLMYGPAHRVLLPASATLGAVFVVLADLIARIGIGGEQIPLGIVTAVIGAPFFIHLLRRGRSTYGA
jgi:iron complex transport system permease protein